jgi:hypothetical protein
MKLNINSKGRVTNSIGSMYYLGDKQRIWLWECKFGDNMEINDWFLSLPLTLEQTNMLNHICIDGYYDDRSRDLLNWLREEYISTFGIGSTMSIIDTLSPI